MVWLTVIGVLIAVAYFLILRRRAGPATTLAPASPEQAGPSSVDEARALVDTLIAEKLEIFAEPALGPVTCPELLSATTLEFFGRFASLKTRRAGFRLASADIRPSEYARGYVSIGHSEDWDVVQRAGSDDVFVVEGTVKSEAEMDVRFPSIYHLVLDEAQRSAAARVRAGA